jgi:hypothetical protein
MFALLALALLASAETTANWDDLPVDERHFLEDMLKLNAQKWSTAGAEREKLEHFANEKAANRKDQIDKVVSALTSPGTKDDTTAIVGGLETAKIDDRALHIWHPEVKETLDELAAKRPAPPNQSPPKVSTKGRLDKLSQRYGEKAGAEGFGDDADSRDVSRGSVIPVIGPIVEPSEIPVEVNGGTIQEPPKIQDSNRPISERGYLSDTFSRGIGSGMIRLRDDFNLGFNHLLGISTTEGDPDRKARFTFVQRGPTCSVATQKEAMDSRGVDVPYQELVREGQRTHVLTWRHNPWDPTQVGGGVMAEDDGALARMHGFTVFNNCTATGCTPPPPGDLERRVGSRDEETIVAMDSGALWFGHPSHRSHSVYVTGVERRRDGTVLGYYINDTAWGEAARFVPIDIFNAAWNAAGRGMVVIR